MATEQTKKMTLKDAEKLQAAGYPFVLRHGGNEWPIDRIRKIRITSLSKQIVLECWTPNGFYVFPLKQCRIRQGTVS